LPRPESISSVPARPHRHCGRVWFSVQGAPPTEALARISPPPAPAGEPECPFCYTNTIRSPPRHVSVGPGRKQLEEVMPRGCAMVVRITPRNDRVLVNEPAGVITINSRRAETVGGACNFRSIKRAGMNKWHIHALCSADGNSWNANIVLKLIGSELRW